jgi:uncharacterized membrane protein YhaH (DUF805 family)
LSWRDIFWGWRGRLNRLQFFVGLLTLTIILKVLTYNLSPFSTVDEDGEVILQVSGDWIAYNVAIAVWAPFVASLLTRRLHDIGLVSWWVIVLWAAGLVQTQLIFIWPHIFPFWTRIVLGLPVGVMVFAALVAGSNEGENRFGSQPAPGLPKRW